MAKEITAKSVVKKLTRKDFTSDQEVRWCPGCGDYAILAALQRTLPEIGQGRENTVVVSGIGCSSRFPYYMNTYGFHTIHGRAPAVATGLKVTNPELDVWMVTGDGDGLSIGGNHMLHILRRNIDLQLMLFNNQIYGLTKGQYSPTSVQGKVTPSSPLGSVDSPIHPLHFALGAGAHFVSRGYDVSKKLGPLMKEAKAFRGTGFIEILQNCPVFNDDAFVQITDRKSAPMHQVWCEHGQKLTFGTEDKKLGLHLNTTSLQIEVRTIGEDGFGEDDVLVHDETNRSLAWILADLPGVVALGVLYRNPTPPDFVGALRGQVESAMSKNPDPSLDDLLQSGHTWQVD